MAVLLGSELKAHLEGLLGGTLRSVATVSGGDINDAYRIGLEDGRRYFVKSSRSAPPDLFRREAEGLAFLREGLAGTTLSVPDVVARSERVLVLELLESSPHTPPVEEALGHGLASLHRHGPGEFGLAHDNYIGTLPQPNRSTADWATFYGERRLLHQASLPGAKRLLEKNLQRRLERLVGRLGELVGDPEPPARLHGDLWGGNWMVAGTRPFLVDPAVYGGHREVDLAMMQLFGGFSERVFAAYDEVYPRAPGHAERVPLYQLYPLLVHVNLFGAGYVSGVVRAIERYV